MGHNINFNVEAAYKYSASQKRQLENDKICGCFYCGKIFAPMEIDMWINDVGGTAICPYCGVDSVIGESSGYPITKELLDIMNKTYFDK